MNDNEQALITALAALREDPALATSAARVRVRLSVGDSPRPLWPLALFVLGTLACALVVARLWNVDSAADDPREEEIAALEAYDDAVYNAPEAESFDRLYDDYVAAIHH